MSYRDREKRKAFLPALAVSIGAAVVLFNTGPIIRHGVMDPIPALAATVAVITGMTALSGFFLYVAKVADWLVARTPKGLHGSAGFIKSLKEIRHELIPQGSGPYWGTFKKIAVFADFVSNSMSIGPAGSGKGIGTVQPMIMALGEAGRDMIIPDFKGELLAVLGGALKAMGFEVRNINIGDVWSDILPPSDEFNFLHLVADNFWRPGGLLDISDDVEELNLQLSPAPNGDAGKGENKFWRYGEQSFIGFGALTLVMIEGYNANFGDVAQLLNDREKLIHYALWGAGRLVLEGDGPPEERLSAMPIEDSPWISKHDPDDVQNFIEYYRGFAGRIGDQLLADDQRTVDSFLTGAQQTLSRFNITTRAHKKTRRSTIRFSDHKEGKKKATFIVVDASRINAQKKVLGLIQWAALTELKRCPNKHRPVHIIADEATNYPLQDLDSLLTWGRSYGIRIHLIFQSLSAFRKAYGKEALNTLLNETEIKQFLAGQRDPETLEVIEKILGQTPFVGQNFNGVVDDDYFGLNGFGYQEAARPLMTADEIRRTDKTILIVRNNKPLLTDLPPIAAIHPWRKMIGINPFYGKPFLQTIKLRLHTRRSRLIAKLRHWVSQLAFWRS